jgi:Ca2+-binding EF-hand superfamily protein
MSHDTEAMRPPIRSTVLLACLAIPALAALPQDRGGGSPAAPKAGGQGPAARIGEEVKAEAERENRELAGKYFEVADYDANGWISFREARESLEIDRNRYLVYDGDRDGRVTVEEYTAISLETARRYGVFKTPLANPEDPASQALLEAVIGTDPVESESDEFEAFPTDAGSVEDLFGRVRQRIWREHSVPEPDQLVGPVPSFRRLDTDDDGGIGREDLSILLTGSGLDVRPNALVAAVDANGDGSVSEAEFYASMSSSAD